MRLPLTLFLDTSVILDELIPCKEFSRESGLLFFMAQCDDARLHWSTSMVADLFSIAKRCTTEDSLTISRKLTKLMFGPSAKNVFVHGVDEKDIKNALIRSWADFEDCLVAVCAERVNADYIVTRNGKDFSLSTIPAITPAELLRKVEREAGITYDEIEW